MRSFFVFVLAAILNFPLYAQHNNGTITGKITDSNGLPVSNIYVTATGTNNGTTTDEKGHYLFKLLVGNNTLVAHGIGYVTTEKQITVNTGNTIELNFTLTDDPKLLAGVMISGVKVRSATATRTTLQLLDIPQSIVVVGQKSIREQAAIDLTTITRNISGLNFSGNYSGAGSSQMFNARGFDLADGQNYRWNGMMIWNLGNNYSDNIEQIEFLKGPASILFGDVAPGGVMNFVTKKPLADFMANVNVKTGSWHLVRPSVDITGSITADHTLRFRLNTSFEHSNSFRNYVSSQKEMIAPSLAWDITPKLSFNVDMVFKRSRATDDAGLVSPDGTVAGLDKLDPSLYLGEPARNYLFKDQRYFATLTYQLSGTWRLKATGFYGHTTNRPFGLWFEQPDASGDFERTQYGYYGVNNNGSGSVEAFGSFYTGGIKHNVLVGAEIQSTDSRYSSTDQLSPYDTDNIYKPVYGVTPTIEPSTSTYLPYKSIIARRGLYLQDQIMFFKESLHLLLGARIGRTKQGNHYYQDQLAGTDYEGNQDDIIAKNVFTPRIGLVYKPQAWSSLYMSYSKGYEVNSPVLLAQNYKEYTNPPATLSSQVEFGTKLNLFQDMLGVTFAAFRIDKHHPSGYVYLNPQNPDYDRYNVYYEGHHRSQGIELDVSGRVSKTVSLTAGGAYTKTKVMDDPGYPTGSQLPGAPKFTGNFWLNYEPVMALKGFTFGTGFFYKDKFFSSIANDSNLQVPASYTIDASAGYNYRQMGIQLNVMNLTNRISYLNPWQFNLFDVKPLRQLVITLNYKITKAKGN